MQLLFRLLIACFEAVSSTWLSVMLLHVQKRGNAGLGDLLQLLNYILDSQLVFW
jgi:hypothetical protein